MLNSEEPKWLISAERLRDINQYNLTVIEMQVKLAAIILCLLIQTSYLGLAQDVDLTGTWESKYQFGPIEEVMTAKIQQVGANLLGSFSVKPNTGNEYSGIIFGRVEGDKVLANYL